MLFIDTTFTEVILISITSLVGIFAVSSSLEGYLLHHMPWHQRFMTLAGGLLLIYPGIVTDLLGVVFVLITVVLQIITKKKDAVIA